MLQAEGAAGGLLAMTEVAGAIARPGGGLLSDRVFGGNRKKVFILMAATTSTMCLIMGFLGPYLSWSLYPALLILGMGSISFGGVWLTLLSEFGGLRGTGRAVGLGGMITLAGAALGPPFFGLIVDATHSYTWAWLSLAFGGALCVLLLVFARESKRKI